MALINVWGYLILTIVFVFFSPVVFLLLRGISDKFRDIEIKKGVKLSILFVVIFIFILWWITLIFSSILDVSRGGKLLLDIDVLQLYIRILQEKIEQNNIPLITSILLMITVGILYSASEKERLAISGALFLLAGILYASIILPELLGLFAYTNDLLFTIVAIGLFVIIPIFIFFWVGTSLYALLSLMKPPTSRTGFLGSAESWTRRIYSYKLFFGKINVAVLFILIFLSIVGLSLFQVTAPPSTEVFDEIYIDEYTDIIDGYKVDLKEEFQKNKDLVKPIGVWTYQFYRLYDSSSDRELYQLEFIWDEKDYELLIFNSSVISIPDQYIEDFYLQSTDDRIVVLIQTSAPPANIAYQILDIFGFGEAWKIVVYIILIVLIGFILYGIFYMTGLKDIEQIVYRHKRKKFIRRKSVKIKKIR